MSQHTRVACCTRWHKKFACAWNVADVLYSMVDQSAKHTGLRYLLWYLYLSLGNSEYQSIVLGVNTFKVVEIFSCYSDGHVQLDIGFSYIRQVPRVWMIKVTNKWYAVCTDECTELENVCPEDTQCVNTVGSYECRECRYRRKRVCSRCPGNYCCFMHICSALEYVTSNKLASRCGLRARGDNTCANYTLHVISLFWVH